jgi:hypothetical protein
MKFAAIIFASATLLAAADPQAKDTSSSNAPAPATAPTPKRLTIPEGAVQMPDGRFAFTDAEGRHWIYVRSPFGVTRFEDKPGAPGATSDAAGPFGAAKPADPFANVKVSESGDVVTFERPSPFGISKWQKKKSELTEQENAALLRSRDKAKPSDSAKQVSAKQE